MNCDTIDWGVVRSLWSGGTCTPFDFNRPLTQLSVAVAESAFAAVFPWHPALAMHAAGNECCGCDSDVHGGSTPLFVLIAQLRRLCQAHL